MHHLSFANDVKTGKNAVFLFLGLIVAGLAANCFPFSILNAHFIFGSIFAMLALQRFGFGPGVIAAAVIAGYTYLSWNHPWAIVTMTAEVAVVGWLISRRKIHLVVADALYWILVGIPLGYFCFHILSDFPVSNSFFLMTKQAINGIANALIARFLFAGYAIRSVVSRISFRELISNLLVSFVMLPFLILLTVDGRIDMAQTDRQIRDTIKQDSRQLVENLETWMSDRQQTVAVLAGMTGMLSPQEMQAHLEQAHAADINFLRMALLDKESTVIAFSPMVDELGQSNIGKNFADRTYLPVLKQFLKPMLSEVLLSRIGHPVPIAMVLAPVLSSGFYGGYVAGILNFDRIQTILKNSSFGQDLRYTLIDRNGIVIMTNRNDQKSMGPFDRGKGSINDLENGISQWIPPLSPNTPTIELWGKSIYVAESAIGDISEWKLILEQPVAPFQKILYDRYILKLFMFFAILIAALLLAEFVSRQVVKSINHIGLLTRALPAKLASNQTIEWYESHILENNQLIVNFQEMADSLQAKFIENREITESLEQRIVERTAELRQSEAFFKDMVENIPAMVFMKDAATLCFVRLNRAGEELLGYSRETLLGKSDHAFFPKDEADFFVAKDREVLSRGQLVEIPEEKIQTRYQGERILHTKKIPVFDQDGNPRYLLGISEDITERRKNETALQEVNQDLMQSQTAMLNILEDLKAENDAREKLQAQLLQAQKMEAVGRLAGGVAHDFNNMLNVIIGYTELSLGQLKPDEALHANLVEVLSAAERSADITRQLLAFARKQTVAPKVLDLNETVEGMLKMLRRLIGEDIDLSWKPGSGLGTVNMDPSQIDQILANVCVNARDAIAGVGRLTIETANVHFDQAFCADHAGFVPGGYVMLAVSDDGCGMDQETLKNLFEPFFTTKAVGQGTGLGLATVYGIVKQNEGFINVYSEPGQGTTFKIFLPRYAGKADGPATQPKEKITAGHGETILVVEDETMVLKLACIILEGLGYTVMAAATPAESLRLAEAHAGQIDLLITDVVMPAMNGRELSGRLHARYPKIKTLFMSGYTANVIAHHGVLDKGVHFIQKPFSREGLATRVRNALEN